MPLVKNFVFQTWLTVSIIYLTSTITFTLTAENDNWKYIGILTQHAQWKYTQKIIYIWHILPWKPNLGKPTFSVSFYFNLKALFRNYNLRNLIDWYETHSPIRNYNLRYLSDWYETHSPICCPSFVPDCLPISESPIMKWYTPAWDPLNPKTSWVCLPHTHTLMHSHMRALILAHKHSLLLAYKHCSLPYKHTLNLSLDLLL